MFSFFFSFQEKNDQASTPKASTPHSTGKKNKLFNPKALRENMADLHFFPGGTKKRSENKLLELQRELGLEMHRQPSEDFSPDEKRSVSDSSSVTEGSLLGAELLSDIDSYPLAEQCVISVEVVKLRGIKSMSVWGSANPYVYFTLGMRFPCTLSSCLL